MRHKAHFSRDWEELAAMDPLWAILADSRKQFGLWGLEDFFRSGKEEVVGLMQKAANLGLPRLRRKAIDFGCGVGRLTRALHGYFPECHGVDISESMIKSAQELNNTCEFHHAADLNGFPAGYADFIYSNMVLQHQPDTETALKLIADMLRVLAPSGLLIFQIPIHMRWRNRLQLRRRAYHVLRETGLSQDFLYRRLRLNPVRMIAVPEPAITEVVVDDGGIMRQIEHIGSMKTAYLSGIYYCSKQNE